MSDKRNAHGDSNTSVVIGFLLVLIVTIYALYISGTIYLPGFR
jgi:hypothetical protein